MGRSIIYHRHINDEVEKDGYHPGGCMWGLIHALDYHHWNHNVKRILHHEKHEVKTHAKGKVNPKTSLTLHKNDELQQKLLKSNVNPNTKNKKSIKARIRSLIAEEMSEQESDKKQKKSGYSPRHQLQRTVSIHYLESSDHGLDKMRTNEDDGNISINSPQIKVPDKDSCGEVSTGEFLHTLANSRTKARLTKSGTFPKADSSRRMSLKPTTLEQKKNEIWFSQEEERRLHSELALPNYKRNFRARSWTLANDHEFTIIDRKSSLIPQKSRIELEKLGQDEMVIAMEENKQRVEPKVKEKVITDGEPTSGDFLPDASRTSLDRAINKDDEADSNGFDEMDEYSLTKMAVDYRRGSSFDDSLHRYARLLEYSTREQIILHSSKSLQLRNELAERTDSLRMMESNIKNGDSAELLDHIEKVDDTDDKITPPGEEDVNYTEGNIEKLSESILESNSEATLLGRCMPTYSSEDSDEQGDQFIDSEEIADDTNSMSTSTPNLQSCENGNENFKNRVKSEFYQKDDFDLNYVREILERSDLYRDISNGTLRFVDPMEMECSKEDMYDDSHHQFLYDLVIEVIIQMYDRSFPLYPKALSSSSHVHPLPSENRFLDQVYSSISDLLSTNSKQYQILDDYVSRDFAKDDGWVNLQSESECVALELEDIIFDELLEELLFS